MKLYRSQGRVWTGTQADAKAAQGGADFETIEVPVDKPSLIKWLNEFDVRPFDRYNHDANVNQSTAPASFAMSGVAAPSSLPSAAPNLSSVGVTPVDPEPVMREAQKARFEALARKMGWTPPDEVGEAPASPPAIVLDLESEIHKLDKKPLIRALTAGMSRLNEIAGINGWAAFARDVYSWSPHAKSVERGLGMLMMAGLMTVGEKTQQLDEATA